MENNNPQISALKKISAILNKNRFRFCLAGGLAVGIHASPRATEDIDMIIELDKSRRPMLLSALAHDFKLIQEKDISFSFADIWRLVFKKNNLDDLIVLDFIIANSTELKDAIANAINLEIDSVEMPVISKDSLVALKRNSPRLKDKLDIESLEAEDENRSR